MDEYFVENDLGMFNIICMADRYRQIIIIVQARKSTLITLALVISVLTETRLFSTNSLHTLTGYGALTIHAFSTSALDSTLGILSPSLGSTFTIALTTLGASIFALPFYLFRLVLVCTPPVKSIPAIPLTFHIQLARFSR